MMNNRNCLIFILFIIFCGSLICGNETYKDSFSELIDAIYNSEYTKVHRLLRQGVDPNPRDESDECPLIIAANNLVDQKMVRLLLENGADVNQTSEIYNSNTALMLIMNLYNEPMVHLLIEAGADLNHQDEKGMTALMYAQGPEITNLLIQKGARLDIVDCEGRTALFHAVIGNRYEKTKCLLENGAEVNITDHYGLIPLVYAWHKGDDPIVELLSKRSITTDEFDFLINCIQNTLSRDNLQTITRCENKVLLRKGLFFALYHGNLELIEYLKNCLDFNRRIVFLGYHSYPIYIAIGRNNLELVQYLVKIGVDLGLEDQKGIDVLKFARFSGKHRIYLYLKSILSEEKE